MLVSKGCIKNVAIFPSLSAKRLLPSAHFLVHLHIRISRSHLANAGYTASITLKPKEKINFNYQKYDTHPLSVSPASTRVGGGGGESNTSDDIT